MKTDLHMSITEALDALEPMARRAEIIGHVAQHRQDLTYQQSSHFLSPLSWERLWTLC